MRIVIDLRAIAARLVQAFDAVFVGPADFPPLPPAVPSAPAASPQPDAKEITMTLKDEAQAAAARLEKAAVDIGDLIAAAVAKAKAEAETAAAAALAASQAEYAEAKGVYETAIAALEQKLEAQKAA